MSAFASKFTVETETTKLQQDTEAEVSPFFIKLDGLNDSQLKHLRDVGLVNETGYDVRLLREKHVKYLLTGLGNLSAGYSSLDASRPWIAYWCLHSLDLLDAVDDDFCPRVVSTLKSFQNETGGFGGGPMQLSHGAPTYASCLALLLVAPKCPAAYECIDRPALYKWFLAMKTPTGGFRMHDDGEVDVRGTYTVIAIAALCNLLTPELCENVAEFTVSCQTYEGGFGGEPGNEAHGGYAFCAVAALQILGKLDMCDVEALKGWIARRQMSFEGGFQGRANKLVDGCYSFWQGGAMAVVNAAEIGLSGFDSGVEEFIPEVDSSGDGVDVSKVAEATPSAGGLTFDQGLLQRYVLLCGQHVEGGLRDKPSKMRDYYHTCYNLSGLSVSQHVLSEDGVPVVYGDSANVIAPTHACFNIRVDRVKAAQTYFKDKICDHTELIK
ncbi:hypothetical protein TrST_g12683 [Triparma strigata]|uniref:Protein farnesyltransferase subunit beta n=1 Tax=Triparma strigata TaxID=1606541 RepID=A0A9W7BSD2_9STRA|nr:hypothetical protein TrST_g12683 [Triparma strigata]